MTEQKTGVTGTIRLEVDAEGLEAQLVYERDPSGTTWREAEISELLMEKALELSDRRTLRAVVEKLSASAARKTVLTIARGKAAVPAACDVPSWTAAPVPPELVSLCDSVLRDAPPPHIVTVQEEKVRRQKVLQKKSQFPFRQGKEEKAYVFEKVRREVPVQVDPRVLEVGFVRKGAVIADLQEGGEGQPGSTVFGTLLPVPKEPVPAVYPGDGVVKRDLQFVAETTGFLRKGGNWVDIVPFEHHAWALGFSRDRGTCTLSFTPGRIPEGLPRAPDVIREIQEQGYPPEALISEEEIDSLLVDAFRTGIPLENVQLSRDCDAAMRIDVTEEKLEARLVVRKGQGRGKPLVLGDLGKLIKSSGLRGLDFEKIREDILAFYRGPLLELPGYTLIAGTVPGRGPDREVTFHFEPMSAREQSACLEQLSEIPPGEPGPASLAEFPVSAVSALSYVKKGFQIAELSPAVQGEAGLDIYGKVVPGLPGNDPDIRLFENLRFEKDMIITEEDGLLEKGERDGAILLRVRKHRDARVSLVVTEDRMKAFLSIEVPEGSGSGIDCATIRRLVAEQGIVNGIREEAIVEAVRNVAEGREVRDACIAEGNPPRDGMENRIQFKVRLEEQKAVTIRANGNADYRNQNRIVEVMEGDVIAEVLPPDTLPVNGCDVLGKVVQARSSPPLKLQIGKNIRQEAVGDGMMRLVAGATGELIHVKGLLEIRNIHVVPGDVDFKCGNIRFPGTVLVKGSVLSGFHIFAGADIMIDQVAQASLLSADGNVFVKLGIKGGGKGVLRSKKNIAAGFVEQAVLLSVGDVRVEKSCIHSRIRCNGQVMLAQERGTLFGGSVKARRGMSVFNLGSENGVRTEISFGQDYLVADQIETEEKEIEKLKMRISQLDTMMKAQERNGNRSEIDAFRKEKISLLKMMEKRGFRLFTLREKFEEHFPAEISVRGTLYPGVVFESHGRKLEMKSEKKNLCIYFDPDTGRIQEKPLKNRK